MVSVGSAEETQQYRLGWRKLGWHRLGKCRLGKPRLGRMQVSHG